MLHFADIFFGAALCSHILLLRQHRCTCPSTHNACDDVRHAVLCTCCNFHHLCLLISDVSGIVALRHNSWELPQRRFVSCIGVVVQDPHRFAVATCWNMTV